MALYISTFNNINIFYTPGQTLFWSDLLSRQYNEVYMENNKMNPDFDDRKRAIVFNLSILLRTGSGTYILEQGETYS